MLAFTRAVAAATVVFDFLDGNGADKDEGATEMGAQGTHGALDLDTCQGRLELRDLSFAYPSRPDRNALSSMNLTFRWGRPPL